MVSEVGFLRNPKKGYNAKKNYQKKDLSVDDISKKLKILFSRNIKNIVMLKKC
jgi:DUF1009 family protein